MKDFCNKRLLCRRECWHFHEMYKMWWSYWFPYPSSVMPSDLYQVSHISSPCHSIHLIHFIQLFSIFAALVMLSTNQGHLICLVQPRIFIATLAQYFSLLIPDAFMLKNQLENEDWRFSVSWSICNFVFRLLSSVKCMFLTVSSFNFFCHHFTRLLTRSFVHVLARLFPLSLSLARFIRPCIGFFEML